MAVNIEQVKELLGNGLAVETVASAVGCSPSYVTQLMSDDVFSGEVAALRVNNLSANTTRDRSIDKIEDEIIKRLGDAVANHMIYKPQELLRTFQVLNSAKRRGANAGDGANIQKTEIITLILPARPAEQFTITPQGTVVDVGGQSLVSMSANELLKKLATSGDTSNKQAAYATISKYLPTTRDNPDG